MLDAAPLVVGFGEIGCGRVLGRSGRRLWRFIVDNFEGAGGKACPTPPGPKIVIAGTREDWPGGAQTLTPRDPTREPNGRILWFGAALDADGSQQVWFRITAAAVGRMREKTPRARGARLIDALLAWLTPDRQLQPELNRFEVRISEAGDTWIERLRW